MSRMGSFLMGFVVGGLAVYGSLNYHVLRTKDGFELVPKLSATFKESYLDVRQYTTSDWSQHKTVLSALVRAKKEHLITDSASQQLTEGIDNLLGDLGLSTERR